MIFVCEVTILPPRSGWPPDRVRHRAAFLLFSVLAHTDRGRSNCGAMDSPRDVDPTKMTEDQHRGRCNRRWLQSYPGVAKEGIGRCATPEETVSPSEGSRDADMAPSTRAKS